jgi:type IV pilus assembly protein PilW
MVEIMVGMVIGLLGIIVMMNLFSNFEAQKRTTTGASEIQNDGAIALFSLQRDIQQAGFGISMKNLFGCNVTVVANPPYPATAFTLPAFAPLTINPASSVLPTGDANTDTLLVAYGNSSTQPEGEIIISFASAVPVVTFNSKYQPTNVHFLANDEVIFEPVTRPSPCNLTLDSVAGSGPTTVSLKTGVTYNIPVVPDNLGKLFNVGNPVTGTGFKVNGYAIRNGNLTFCDYMLSNCTVTANWTTVANDIVSMRAQYGRDDVAINPVMSGIVNVYDQTTPLPASATYACDWLRISSVRLALVGRNGQPEKTLVTAAAPLWAGSGTDPINLAANNPPGFTWQNYRYKVFETTVPIRNVAIIGAPTQGDNSGC